MNALHLEGGLQRQVGVLKSWKRYQCELKDDVLTCRSVSKGNKGSLKKDAIDLSQAHSVRKLNSQQLGFQIVAKSGKTHTFAADSQELLSKWISALQMAMQVKRRSQMSALSDPDRETQYAEPWDLKQPILPIFFNQESRYPSSSELYATVDHCSNRSESAYATTNDFGHDQSESDYATTYEFEREPMERAYAANRNSTEAEVIDDPSDEEGGYAEVRVVNRTYKDIKPSQFAHEEDSPLILRRSKSSSSSYESFHQSNESSFRQVPTSASDATATVDMNLNEEDIEKLLFDLKSMINRSSSSSLPKVEYSPAVLELSELIDSNEDGYQMVNRRETLKGSYIDKLRGLLDDSKTGPRMVRFQMDF